MIFLVICDRNHVKKVKCAKLEFMSFLQAISLPVISPFFGATFVPKNHQIFKQTDFFSVIKARPHQSFFISIKLLVRLKYFFKEDFQIGVTQGELLSIAEQMWREFSLLQRKKQLRPLPYRRCHSST